jgi:hypothetical protein
MGHVKVDTTVNVYTQVLGGATWAAADRIGSELVTIVHRPKTGRRQFIEKTGSPHWTISATG